MKKKASKFAAFLIVSTVLAACGQSPKDAYLEAMDKASEAKAGKIDMTVQDIQLSDDGSQTDAMMNIVQSQLQEMKMTGTYSMPKDNEYALNLNMSVLGQDIPINMVGHNDRTYMSTTFITALIQLIQSLSGTKLDQGTLQSLDGKYMDMQHFVSEANETSATTGVDLSQFENLNMKNSLAYQKDLYDEFANYLRDEVKDERFTEKNGKLSFTMTEKDIVKLADIQQQLAKNYPQFNINLHTLLAAVDSMSVETTIDEDREKQTYKVHLASTKNDIDAIQFVISNKLSEKVEAVDIPQDHQIVSQEQLHKLFNPSNAEISEAQFNELLEQAKVAKKALTPAQKKATLKQYKDYLTSEQYEKLAEILGK